MVVMTTKNSKTVYNYFKTVFLGVSKQRVATCLVPERNYLAPLVCHSKNHPNFL